MSSVLLYANDDAPKGASPTIIPRWFCRLEMLMISGRYCYCFFLLLSMVDGLLFNLAQDGGLHLLAGATGSAGGFGGVLEFVLGEADAHYSMFS